MYNNRNMRIELPAPPKPPLCRLIRESSVGGCKDCGSSLHYKWIMFKSDGCIHPKCENYWKRKGK